MTGTHGRRDRPSVEAVIETLGLRPLPDEGGFYRVTYESDLVLPTGLLSPGTRPAGAATPDDNPGRRCGSAIYYLITPEGFSALHRLRFPEIFHFYLGDPLDMLQLHPEGGGHRVSIGHDLRAGQRPQVLVPADVWQGTKLRDAGGYALLGTTMSPAFDREDFELGRRDALIAAYPGFGAEITRLTR